MLKQFMLADGKIDDIEVEEKYVRWTEQLRSDRYVTVPKHMMDTHTLVNRCVHGMSWPARLIQVTKLQLYKIYGKSKEAKLFVEELIKGH